VTWSYLRGFVEDSDTAIFSPSDYERNLATDLRFITPADSAYSRRQ
jgi:hypothetical protein